MNKLEEFNNKVMSENLTVGVVGLGYVGLPLACMCAIHFGRVVAYDIDELKVNTIKNDESPIQESGMGDMITAALSMGMEPTTDPTSLAACDVITINIQTPVDSDHIPDYGAIKLFFQQLAISIPGERLEDILIIVESTLGPGTMNNVILPMVKALKPKRTAPSDPEEKPILLGYCPERVMPGKLIQNLVRMPRVCGAQNETTAEMMKAFYKVITSGDITITDWITAELAKTAENTHRDVNIAFVNELADICEAVGGDVWKVRDIINKVPGKHLLEPGAGVGGHCIPKDPWLLMHYPSKMNTPMMVIPSARSVNHYRKMAIMRMIIQGLVELTRHPVKHNNAPRILVLGVSYLENTDDIRNSPTMELASHLKNKNATVTYHDPFVESDLISQGDVLELAADHDIIVLMVKHDQYKTVDWASLDQHMDPPVVIDGRGFLRDQVQPSWFYRCVGIAPGREP